MREEIYAELIYANKEQVKIMRNLFMRITEKCEILRDSFFKYACGVYQTRKKLFKRKTMFFVANLKSFHLKSQKCSSYVDFPPFFSKAKWRM